MSARPSSVFAWAASAPTGFVLPVPPALRGSGFIPGSPASSAYVNQVLAELAAWIDYLGTLSPSTNRLDVGRIVGVGDPSGSGRGLYVTTTGGLGITLLPDGNGGLTLATSGTSDAVLQTTGAGGAVVRASGAGGKARLTNVGGSGTGVVEVDRDTGAVRLAGPSVTSEDRHTFDEGTQATEDPTSKLRYAYKSTDPLDVDVDIGPELGGWAAHAAVAGVHFVDTVNDFTGLRNDSGGVATVTGKRALDWLFRNGEADGTTVRYKLVSLSGTFSGTSGTTLRIMRHQRGVAASATAVLTISHADTSDDNGGTPIDVDIANYTYRAQIDHAGLADGTNTDLLRDVVLKVRKYAVE